MFGSNQQSTDYADYTDRNSKKGKWPWVILESVKSADCLYIAQPT